MLHSCSLHQNYQHNTYNLNSATYIMWKKQNKTNLNKTKLGQKTSGEARESFRLSVENFEV